MGMAIKKTRRLVLACAVALAAAACSRPRPDGLHRDSRPSIDPKNGTIVLSAAARGKSDLYRLSRGGSLIGRLTTGGADNVQPAISPTGRQIAFVCEKPDGRGHICVVDGNGGNVRALTNRDDGDERWPTFVGEQSVVFARAAVHRPYSLGGQVWDRYDLYESSLATGSERRLTHDEFRQILGTSGGGASVVFSGESRQAGASVLRMNTTDGTSAAVVTNGTYPAATADTSRVLFIDRTGEQDTSGYYEYEVWLWAGTSRQLTHNHSYNLSPAWAPNGEWFLFLSDRNRDHHCTLWESDADATHLHEIHVPVG